MSAASLGLGLADERAPSSDTLFKVMKALGFELTLKAERGCSVGCQPTLKTFITASPR